MLLRAGRFGDLRRKILSWWRSARLSISSEARDRNNPISPHQISLHSSIIEQKLHPIRCCSPVVLGLRQGQLPLDGRQCRFFDRSGEHDDGIEHASPQTLRPAPEIPSMETLRDCALSRHVDQVRGRR
jgi:hypothetical protein